MRASPRLCGQYFRHSDVCEKAVLLQPQQKTQRQQHQRRKQQQQTRYPQPSRLREFSGFLRTFAMSTTGTDSDMPPLTESSSEDEALLSEAQAKSRRDAVGDRGTHAHLGTGAVACIRARGQAPFSWAYGFSGEDSVFDLVPAEALANYEYLATRRPIARAHLAEPEDRETCVFLAAAFFLSVRRLQVEHGGIPLTPPCDRCALPTGSCCDVCRKPLCKFCDQRYGRCGECAGSPTQLEFDTS